MRKLILIIFISLMWGTPKTTVKAYSEVPIKSFFITCKGTLDVSSGSWKNDTENFYQDIKINFYNPKNQNHNLSEMIMSYEIVTSSELMSRPHEIAQLVYDINSELDKEFIEKFLSYGGGLIDNNSQDGIIKITGGSENLKNYNPEFWLSKYSEILNLNVGTLSINIVVEGKNKFYFTARANCNQNQELLSYLKKRKNSSGQTFKDILGKYLGK
jgi:hypothetical protein